MLEMDQFLKEFGKTLKATRKQMGLSQVMAAQNMRIDYRHYQNIEGGKINLRLDTLMKLVRFYNLDKQGRGFNLDVCLDILGGFDGHQTQDNWQAIYNHFVEGGHAGYAVINASTRTVSHINERLFRTLGYRSESDLVGHPISHLIVPESVQKLDQTAREADAYHVSKPFIVTFKTQPPAFPIPMMAVIKSMYNPANGAQELQCIFFDRKTLDEEGHRLKDILSGYQQFMQLYPQLRAV